MSNLKKTSYVFIALAIALLLAAISITVAFNVNKAYADYEDVINNPESIVNFNQYVKTEYTHQQYVPAGDNYIFTIPEDGIRAGDKIYFKLDRQYENTCILAINNNITISSLEYESIITANTFSAVRLYCSDQNVIVRCWFINLSIMFGIGSEPDLTQCQDLFVADYYNYNAGTPISYNTIEAYNNGINSVLSATTFDTITPADFYNNFTSYTYVPTGSSDIYSGLVFQDSDNWCKLSRNTFFDSQDYTNFYSCGYLPLTRSLIAGSNCTISVYAYGDFGAGSTTNNYFEVCAVNSSGALIALAQSPVIGTSNVFASTIDFSFDVPFAADYILIVPKRPGNNYYFKDFSIEQRVLNIDLLQETNYKNGYNEAKSYYESFYGVGGQGYSQIYNSGYTVGMNETNHYTFGYLMSAVIEAPLDAVLDIFNFDFLGYNFKNFITILFTLCFIIAIVRMFMGGKE